VVFIILTLPFPVNFVLIKSLKFVNGFHADILLTKCWVKFYKFEKKGKDGIT